MAIEGRGLSRRFGRRWALANLDLTVPWGSVWMVAGPNGAGKSTLLRILATAIRADLGDARVAGFDLRRERQEVRRRVALLDHHSYAYSALTARENLAVTARLLPAARADANRLESLLAEVGLAGWGDEPLASFSAGMRKRLALARILLQDAEVVLLDEPYGELDPSGFLFVDQAIRRLRERGVTVLLATHLLDRGAELCDRALLLVAGRSVWSGAAAELPGRVGERSPRLRELAR